MPYHVVKNDDIIAIYNRVTVHDGVVTCRDEFGGREMLFLAPGQWDSVFWEASD